MSNLNARFVPPSPSRVRSGTNSAFVRLGNKSPLKEKVGRATLMRNLIYEGER